MHISEKTQFGMTFSVMICLMTSQERQKKLAERKHAQDRSGPLLSFYERLKITDMNDICLKCTYFTQECIFQQLCLAST